MDRRKFIKLLAAIPALTSQTYVPFLSTVQSNPGDNLLKEKTSFKRVRPGDPQWPAAEQWDALKSKVGGRLKKLESVFAGCSNDASKCEELIKGIENPYFIRDNPALTQSSGLYDAWISKPSTYVVEALNANDVSAAVKFAKENNLRLVVKGGGHSYQGTSDCEDSLLIWTREMDAIELVDGFVPQGCDGKVAPVKAVNAGAGAIWMHVYDVVTTKGKRYVQGGGCGTVGVAGLIQSGGFGSFSKGFGTACSGLIEAEIVTADGEIRVVNECQHPELFWALKGGGGGSFGVVTRLTLKTHELPDWIGAVLGTIKASSDAAYKKLITKILEHYRDNLMNPHWGEQVTFTKKNELKLSFLSQGLSKEEQTQIWKTFTDWIDENSNEYEFIEPFIVLAIPAYNFWDGEFMKKTFPTAVKFDTRKDVPANNIYWSSNQEEVARFWYAYKSAWLPQGLLQIENLDKLTDAVFKASRLWSTSLHFNKGLAGASDENRLNAGNTAMNPVVNDSFALVIIAAGGPPAYFGMPGSDVDVIKAKYAAGKIANAIDEFYKVAPDAGSYVSESDYFNANWQKAFWGVNYEKLLSVKEKYDPDCLFYVHHGVGTEKWINNGFERID